MALWNGRDPILKERMFGLSGNQGNHGEDVKECFFYLDATPSHSFLKYLYKYPQASFPYASLVEENSRRSRAQPPFSLLDTGVFAEKRYWDVEITYAKETPDTIFVRIQVKNRGPETATLHLFPASRCAIPGPGGDAEQGEKPCLQIAESVRLPGLLKDVIIRLAGICSMAGSRRKACSLKTKVI